MIVECLIIIFIILLVVNQWKTKKFMKLHQQLGNDFLNIPIVGIGLSLLGSNEDLMKVFIQMQEQAWKRKHNAISFWLTNLFFVSIADADKACVVLKSALDKGFVPKVFKDLVGNGAVFAPVEIWHRSRKILVPTFAPRHVNNFVPVFEAQSKATAELLESRVGKGNFSCFDYISHYALDSVCETLFGVNMDMQRTPGHPFFDAFMECLKIIASRLCQPWLHIDVLYKLLPMYAREKHATNIVHEFVNNLINQKKSLIEESKGIVEDPDKAEDKSKPKFKTFLELMIENSKDTDKAYMDEELRDESVVLALAGTDTSAVGLSFTILLLSQYPDIQDKVYKEIQEVLGDSEKSLKFEDLLKLKYTRAVIKETLRLYPPAPFIVRHCTKELILSPDFVLPEGTNILISIFGIHRNPQYWGEDANDFNPDRFLSGQIPTPNAFLPFSYSFRNCIGQHYAMLSMTTTLVTILRRLRFTPATNFKYGENNPLRLSFEVMMKHVDKFSVQVEHRDK